MAVKSLETDAERIVRLERQLADAERTIALLMEAGRSLAQSWHDLDNALRVHGVWLPSRFHRRFE